MNGDMTRDKIIASSTMTRDERNKKYSLSANLKNKSNGNGNGNGNNHKRDMKDIQKLRKVGHRVQTSHGSSTNSNGNAPTVSGRFRKTEGYFRKKLRNQSTSEFSS